jgi:UDP-glucose 4,6-dehydratase
MAILLLGASGYIGSAFASELHRRKLKFEAPPRRWVDYTKFDVLLNYLKTLNPEFVINAAGYTGKPNVDACESHKMETMRGNYNLPLEIGLACDDLRLKIPWLHCSSGCVYNGIGPFKETDKPNFSFDSPPCSWYSGTKAMGEEAAGNSPRSYICRLRIPFDEFDGPRNYLSKLQRYTKVYNATNSITHRGDFVKACLDLWQTKAPFGTYNMTNPGYVTTRQVVLMIHSMLGLDREWDFFKDDGEFYSTAAVAPRSNCVLNTTKLAGAGVSMRPVEEALSDALHHWRKESNLAAVTNKA